MNRDHRSQLARAQALVRADPSAEFKLDELAKLAGTSRFHFGRIFAAYTGETPFSFIRRIRVLGAMERIRTDESSLTRIAHDIGFGSSAAFSKAFSSVSGMTPTHFRNLGKADAQALIHRLAMNPNTETESMNLEMNDQPELVERQACHAISVVGEGPFAETAPGVWDQLFARVDFASHVTEQTEFLGLSRVEARDGQPPRNVYHAAFTTTDAIELDGCVAVTVPGGRYLQWTLKGAYKNIWPAFHRVLRLAHESEHELRDEPCLEIYLNNPAETPEAELLTALLVPIQ